MAKKQKRPRLKKNPEIADYVVEFTDYAPGGMRQRFEYRGTRAEARKLAKNEHGTSDRIRMFRIKYELDLEWKANK